MMTDSANQTPEQAQPQTQIGTGPQYIKDLSFECPGAPQIFTPGATAAPLTHELGINVHSRGVGDDTFEVILSLKVEAKMDNKTAFILELAYGGVFVIKNMPEETLKLFLMVEAPRLLFPFARAIVASTIHDGGFTSVVLTPMDFMSLYQANKGQLGVTTAAGVA